MSTTLRDRPVLRGPAAGGVPARRAVARWAWRLFRREWRQQVLVLALLTFTVAAAAFSVSAAYNVASLGASHHPSPAGYSNDTGLPEQRSQTTARPAYPPQSPADRAPSRPIGLPSS